MFIPGYWIDKYGNLHNIKEISDDYLKNIINFLKKELESDEYNLIETITIHNKLNELEEELMKRDLLWKKKFIKSNQLLRITKE